MKRPLAGRPADLILPTGERQKKPPGGTGRQKLFSGSTTFRFLSEGLDVRFFRIGLLVFQDQDWFASLDPGRFGFAWTLDYLLLFKGLGSIFQDWMLFVDLDLFGSFRILDRYRF